MQQAQQQTKRRRPHYNLCEGRVENTTPIITLEEAREKLAKEKEKFKEMQSLLSYKQFSYVFMKTEIDGNLLCG